MKVTTYLQVEATHFTNDGHPTRGRVARCTLRYPEYPIGGSAVVKLSLTIPDEAFMPLPAEAEVEMEEVEMIPVDVEDPVEVAE